jgi:hypothetical protein
MHPLSPDLSNLTDADLHKKHGELIKRLHQAHRYGSDVTFQLNMLIGDYQSEIQRRNAVALEEARKNNPNFDGTIDIS